MPYKLGKKPPKFHKDTLSFSKYRLAGAALPEPAKAAWEYKVPNYPVFLNDQLGDCTIACVGHMIQTWTVYGSGLYTPADSDILTAYEAVGGYVPGNEATYVFGGVDIGVNLPNSAMDQFGKGQPWNVVFDDGGIDGGHSIPLFGYGSAGTTCVTWGQRQPMSWNWFLKYCDEAYAAISLDWLTASGTAVNQIDLPTLQADLKAIQMGA